MIFLPIAYNSYNSMASYFNFYVIVLSKGNQVLIKSLWGIWPVSQSCLIHKDLQDIPPFWFLNPFKYLSVQFSSCLLACKTCIHVSCYLLILGLIFKSNVPVFCRNSRGRYRTAATSKMERLLIIVNDFQLLTIITKCSILDVVAVLDPLLNSVFWFLSS